MNEVTLNFDNEPGQPLHGNWEEGESRVVFDSVVTLANSWIARANGLGWEQALIAMRNELTPAECAALLVRLIVGTRNRDFRGEVVSACRGISFQDVPPEERMLLSQAVTARDRNGKLVKPLIADACMALRILTSSDTLNDAFEAAGWNVGQVRFEDKRMRDVLIIPTEVRLLGGEVFVTRSYPWEGKRAMRMVSSSQRSKRIHRRK